MDLFQFIARFHVLVLHLPIGILMLAALLEVATRFRGRTRSSLLNTVWFWGAVSALGACILGWMLSQADGYSAESIFIHRTLGISVAVVAWMCWVIFRRQIHSIFVYSLSGTILLLLFSTGHYGANMTHGETYLVEYAPDPIRVLAGFEPHQTPREKPTELGNADVYHDVIGPVLKKRCASCHNDSKQKGGLNLASYDALMAGGKSGNTLVAGDPDASELYRRITLDHDDKAFMPAEGKKPLSDDEVATLAWWIRAGLPQSGNVANYINKDAQATLLNRLLGLEGNALPSISPISNKQFQQLNQAGFVVKRLSQSLPYLDLDMSLSDKTITSDVLLLLEEIKSHVVYLNLANKTLNAEVISTVALLPNLQKLRLDNTTVVSADLAPLAKATQLTYLNLYATPVDNSVLPILDTIPALKKAYLSDTQVQIDANRTHSTGSAGRYYITSSSRNASAMTTPQRSQQTE